MVDVLKLWAGPVPPGGGGVVDRVTNSPDFLVWNKMKTNWGLPKIQKFNNLPNFVICLSTVLCKIHLNTWPLLTVLCCCVKYNLCYLCLCPVF
jgi:hypothetical protein